MFPILPLPSHRLASSAATSLLLLLAPGLAYAQRPNADVHWVGTWGVAPSTPSNNPYIGTHSYKGNQFNNQTIRLIAHVSLGGSVVRVRLSNEFGAQPLSVGAAHVAVRDSGANTVAGTDRTLTFSRQTSVSIPTGAAVMSDPVCLTVPALGDLAVSLYLPVATTVTTVHELGQQTNYVSPAGGGDVGDATTFPLETSAPSTDEYPILTGVEVLAPKTARAIVTLGDSITDGYGSTPDTNHRWPNLLAARLVANNLPVAVVDAGISGSRLLTDVPGPSGLARFERDEQVAPDASYVTVLLGINDINLGGIVPTAMISGEQIVAGHRQLIARAHELGLKIYGCTLTPAGLNASDEAKRTVVNNFIRGGGEYDAVIDFDAATRDPANPTLFLSAYDSGDHLHPNDAGYEVMANAIDLSLFQ